MKKYLTLLIAAVVFGLTALETSSCSTAPTQRGQTVTTLKIVGASVDASMKIAVQLLRDGHITAAQWNLIATIHDQKFLPAYNLAVAAVQANLDTVASPDLAALAAQLASIVASYQPKQSP